MACHVFITAEIGINHNGDIALACKMIREAAQAGCDAVKFQKRTVDKVYTPEFLASERMSPWGTTQREQKEGLEFGEKEYDMIHDFCRECNIEWFASCWDVASQKFLRKYDLKYNKIASPVLTNIPLLECCAEEGKYTFISTGMSTWEEIDTAVEVFHKYACPFELMHCVSIYPSVPEEANLCMIETLQKRYGVSVGYSGHEIGHFSTLGAVAMGAASIERHFTLDRNMYGSDQKSSIEPSEMKEMVSLIRQMEKARGTGERILTEKELAVRKKMRS